MTIAEYIEMTGMQMKALAEACGCTSSALIDINKGRRFPSLQLAFRIESATGGLVKASDFAKREWNRQ